MDQSEVERLIGELETALDRLRALYEQYFMGIERIEPSVVRKDVDRRFYVLRKEQIRNTAMRYRFQMLLQKYNTYQTHWQRVCREIENGTYKRHLMRAQRRFGSSRPPRRRSSVAPAQLLPEPGASPPQGLAAELAELDRDFAPASGDVEIPIDVEPSSRPSPPPPIVPATPPAAGLPSPALGAPAAPRPISPGGALAWKKVGVSAPVPAGAPVHAAPPPVAPPPALQRAPVMPPQAAQRPASPVQPLPGIPPSSSALARPMPPRPLLAGGSPAAAPPAPAPPLVPLAPPAAKPAAQPGHSRPENPQPVNRPLQAGTQVSPPQRPQPPRPTPSAPPPNVPGHPRPQPPPTAGELSEKRLRQIYVQYVDAKRRQNESTAAISFLSVAKSLRESEGRLRQKHGKEVDFEVAIKDGKTILRPVLK